MRLLTMWYVHRAKAQIRLRICAVWSETLLDAWILYECKATDWTPFEAAQAHVSLHLSKYHIVGNHMPRLKFQCSWISVAWTIEGEDDYSRTWTITGLKNASNFDQMQGWIQAFNPDIVLSFVLFPYSLEIHGDGYCKFEDWLVVFK